MKFDFFGDGLIKVADCLEKKRNKSLGMHPTLISITSNDR
jgi:hypothetical protein